MDDNNKLSIKRDEEEKFIPPGKPITAITPEELIPRVPLHISHKHHYLTIDYLFVIILMAVSFFWIIGTYKGIGYSWDEAFFYDPSVLAAAWLKNLLKGNFLLSQGYINNYWDKITELPSMTKFIVGSGSALFTDSFGELLSIRLPIAVVFALTVGLIYHIGLRGYGRETALFAALSYLFMPRVFGNAHIAATETITCFFILLSVFTFKKGIRDWEWSLVFGIVYGLTMNTKFNALFIPILLILWAHIYYRKEYTNNVFVMVFIAPFIFVVTWPWLWYDTIIKILDYLRFFLTHQFTAVWYFGKKYGYMGAPAPWEYPFVMTLITTPIPIVIAAILGALRAIFEGRFHSRGVLFLIMALFPLCLSALPNSPKYDGTRLFASAFPFIALLAGIGFSGVIDSFRNGEKIKNIIYLRELITLSVIVLFIIYGVFAIYSIHPHELSYFNQFIGGIEGAEKAGMEVTYWGEAVNDDVINFLNDKKNIPEKSKIMTLTLHGKVFTDLQKWGMLRDDLIFTDQGPVDFHIIQNRKGFFARPEWYLYNYWTPLKVFSFKGVPFVMIYKTGVDFENKWRAWKPKASEQ